MKFLIFTFIFIQLTAFNIYAQDEEIENWIYPNDISLRLEFRRYTREDSEILRNKYLLLREQSPVNEWEGEYSIDAGYVDEHKLIWYNNLGFAEYSFYTCFPTLRYVNFGKAEHSPETVKFDSEVKKDSPTKSFLSRTFVKVKWAEKHFLVSEDYLDNFCESAAGLDIKNTNGETEFPNFFTKIEDTEKELSGMPTLPDSYRKFLRYPIETKILSLNKRYITTEKNQWNGEVEKTANYDFTIAAGKQQGVKVGMSFYIPEIDQWFEITKVSEKISVGSFTRNADEKEQDSCSDNENKPILCPKFSTGLEVLTKYQAFNF